jgi:hypothetical protein
MSERPLVPGELLSAWFARHVPDKVAFENILAMVGYCETFGLHAEAAIWQAVAIGLTSRTEGAGR